MSKNYLFMLGLFLAGLVVQAQKRSLTPADFDQWKAITGAELSPDGQHLIYELSPGMGDPSLVITNLKRGTSDTIPRAEDPKFSGDGSYLTFAIKPSLELKRKEETEKISKKKRQTDSLGIYVLSSQKLIKYPDNHGAKMPEKGSAWMAFKTVVLKAESADSLAQGDADTTAVAEKSKEAKRDTLLLALNPIKGDSLSFADVKNFRWAKKSGLLFMQHEDKDSLGVHTALTRFDALTQQLDTLVKRDGEITGLTLDEKGGQMAYLFTADTTDIKSYALHAGTPESLVAVSGIEGLPADWEISKNETPRFSEDGSKLFFGTAFKEQEHPKDTLLDRERAKLDIWAWTDKQLQPMQLLNKSQDEKRTFRAVYHMEDGKAFQLADSSMTNIRLLDDGDANYALGIDADPYERARSWSGLWINDFYLVDTRTGDRKLIAQGQPGIDIGPAQNYALLYDRMDSIYYGIDLASGSRKALTKDLDVVFYDELHDTPSEPRPYGIAGWSKDDKYVYVYDRYDIWRLDPSGKKTPLNVTVNGRTNHTVYRYLELDEDADFIDPRAVATLTVFNELTKRSGFAFARLNKAREPEVTQMGDHRVRFLTKAADANTVVFTKERFDMFPELLVSNTDFANPVKVTAAGAQMDAFKWGETKLVEWKGYDGSQLQGVLYMPENMQAGKKYPMVTYFYERSSDRIHGFNHPAPSRSVVNKSFYVSNDYVIFVPDIVYRDGYPGQSAYDCIVSGVEAMVSEYDFIDGDKVALQGQSWGGYQTAYLITQTDRFAAAMAGAPVSNMTSAYGGIRWGSGMSRMFQYERTQSRLGQTLWDARDLYLENSPLFFADKVNTPLLMMHNDNDGAVPWYQGIEFFVALRRLDQPVWMLNYNGMPHNLSGSAWGNRKDLSVRMMQFFDHYLKGEAAPAWMENGRPAVRKAYDKAY
ncbi:alpha/beta hydrolase family protein [Robertkochia sediminum]|uniref:alpha/beta hydrolase family protein n=1 Tax=Robertkochia sediminum TaxID=2785326 RepID=UPI0019325061|nr:prolyl oligopeptidase family serine peptidase [Robertkochia sediminum]MBL7473648.1 S9 family peptidase [Robertkochia sediminum]